MPPIWPPDLLLLLLLVTSRPEDLQHGLGCRGYPGEREHFLLPRAGGPESAFSDPCSPWAPAEALFRFLLLLGPVSSSAGGCRVGTSAGLQWYLSSGCFCTRVSIQSSYGQRTQAQATEPGLAVHRPPPLLFFNLFSGRATVAWDLSSRPEIRPIAPCIGSMES